jgi:alcohol dehydrogenase, propanol-preferring
VRAMALRGVGRRRVDAVDMHEPAPGPSEVLIKVLACGVCRTDLHVVDGELPHPSIPVVPGHEIVGRVVAAGRDVTTHSPGDRVGVPWLGWSCGACDWCLGGRENLCANARYTGYQLNGGYAEYAVADSGFCFSLPQNYDDAHVARCCVPG